MKHVTAQIFLSKLPDISDISFSDKVNFNQVKLGGEEKSQIVFEEASHFILLPVTGDLYMKSDIGNCEVNVGELKVCRQKSGSRISIINPYDKDVVDFIQIIIRDESIIKSESPCPVVFSLEASLNNLIPVINIINTLMSSFSVHIGQFEGRKETIYPTRFLESTVHIFAICGVFEIEGRLLHPKDGLSIDNASSLEIESLSHNALLLVLECGANNP